MTESNPLQQLAEHGQSFWIDTLDRTMIRSGALADRVRHDGLRGVTSNPAIFLKAISGGDAYDEQVHELAVAGRSLGAIYEELVVQDVREACDVLAPVYRETDGLDGFVSLEVSPYVAHDARATLEEVHRLHSAVDRPNLYVKIPGTAAGVFAIEESLVSGVNVNITLLFGVERYRQVAEAYVRALERRVAEGLEVDGVASVASFFLSRIDVLADRLLAHRISGLDPPWTDEREPSARASGHSAPAGRTSRHEERGRRHVPGPTASSTDSEPPQHLLGRAAIANARVARQVFLDVFSGERWSELVARGARVQRLLWASTGNKNPLYDELRYVEPLIGPDTVSTMPISTAEAFKVRGSVADTLSESGPEGPRRVLARLAEAGVPIERVTERLEDEAVQKFVDPFDELMALLAARREEVVSDATVVAERLGAEGSKLEPLLEALQEQRVPRRLFDLDASLWTTAGTSDGGPSEHMGWLTTLDWFVERVDEVRAFAREARGDGLDQVLLLGMGGSVTTAEAFAGALALLPSSGGPPALTGRQDDEPTEENGIAPPALALRVLDDTHPEAVLEVERALDLTRTLVLVASKSGTTLETLCLYRHFLRRVEEAGVDDPASRFVAMTERGTPLSTEGERSGFRRVFENPPGIGGRFSGLSYFGLVPMVLLGMDIGAVLQGARRTCTACGPLAPAARNPGVRLGALLGGAARRGRNKITLELDGPLVPFGGWIEQLLAESTGKRGHGLVPVVREPAGAPGDYADDRVFVQMRLRGADDARARELDDRARALSDAGHPVVSLEVARVEQMGGEMLRWEIATVTAATVMGVNPFDQPDVERTKRATEDLLEANGRAGGREPHIGGEPVTAFPELLERARPGDYVALLPFFPATDERDARLAELRVRVCEATGWLATTLGYGPRYLHSTGQLHKGGADVGLLVLLTGGGEARLGIPDTPYGFGELHAAQVDADQRTLRELGRRVLRIDLGPDIAAGLSELAEAARGTTAAGAAART